MTSKKLISLLITIPVLGIIVGANRSLTFAHDPSAINTLLQVSTKGDRDAALLDEDGTFRKPARLIELEREHDVSPQDGEVTNELAKAYLDLAQYFMYRSAAPPKQTFPLAYCLYKKVLKVDRRNKTALESVMTIKSIYKQMNKGLPECNLP